VQYACYSPIISARENAIVFMISFRRKKEYRVSVAHDEWVAPEETLVDSHSNYSDLEQPISTSVFKGTTGIVVVLFAIVIGVAFKLSIVSNAFYADLALQNKTVNFAISPPRGIIYDLQGRPLVKNVPSFDLIAISRELPKEKNIRTELAEVIAPIIGKSIEEVEGLIDENIKKNALFIVASDLPKEKILDFTQANPKGFYMIATTKRQYTDGHQFSTIVGYTGKVSRSDLDSDSYYYASDTIGRAGLESFYEESLRGSHGRIYFEQGGESLREEPQAGDSIVLNIDQDIQKNLYSSLFTVLKSAGLSRAAAIVQDPRSGAVLGMVSFPGYDNNIFNGSVSQEEFQKLFLNTNKPLFNRAISGLYNPGSTIKPFIGMAGLQEKVISSSTIIQDCVQLAVPNPFNPNEPSIFKNWRQDIGTFNLRKSIAQSCNVFFYILGGGFENTPGLGITRLVKYLTQGFANAMLGIDLPGEEKGFVPTPDWKKKTRNESWYLGDTYNTSIGQGDLLVTPLWINSYISAIANGGIVYKPRVVSRIIDGSKNTVEIFETQELGKLPFDESVVFQMHYDMGETVRTGTAKALNDLPVTAGAKTGTAEVVKNKSINALFTAFAPLDSPEVTITVLVEGSPSNEGYAINAAHEFLRWYFSRPK
jgi:penicillin-binding protein 2